MITDVDVTFPAFLLSLWDEPYMKIFLGMTLLVLVWYWLYTAWMETAERDQVIRSAKKWKENKEKRNLRDKEGKDLWDSVNQLKRGQRQQRTTYTDQLT